MRIAIQYYDGQTSQAQPGELRIDENGVCWLEVAGAGRRYYPLADLDISPRLGNTPRTLRFPDGGSAETPDNDQVDAALRPHRARGHGWLHWLESHYSSVLVALLVTMLLTAGFVTYGVPWLAGHVAKALPAGVDKALGEQTLAALDRGLFKPSTLDDEAKAQYRARFAELAGDPAAGERLVFRASPVIGANALALPDGTVVMTDELVALSHSPDEVAAVLAHELGHVAGRHALRSALQRSLVVLVVASVTGDVGSAGGIASVLPVVLVDAGYSRDLEREADQHALWLMQRHDIPLSAFPAILRRLAGSHGDAGDGNGPGFLDTHPAVLERAQVFEAAAQGEGR